MYELINCFVGNIAIIDDSGNLYKTIPDFIENYPDDFASAVVKKMYVLEDLLIVIVK